jgi:hypothetical protein
MNLPRRAVATAAVLLGMLVVAATQASPALAGIVGRATASRSVASATFAIVPTQLPTGIPTPGSLPLTFAAGTLPVPQYFSAVNTGTVSITAAGYSVAVTGGTTGTTVKLEACVGASWDTVAGTCAGTSALIGTWTSGSAAVVSSTTVPAAAAARLSLKSTVTGGSALSVTVATISISVSSGPTRQIRAATTTNQ